MADGQLRHRRAANEHCPCGTLGEVNHYQMGWLSSPGHSESVEEMT